MKFSFCNILAQKHQNFKFLVPASIMLHYLWHYLWWVGTHTFLLSNGRAEIPQKRNFTLWGFSPKAPFFTHPPKLMMNVTHQPKGVPVLPTLPLIPHWYPGLSILLVDTQFYPSLQPQLICSVTLPSALVLNVIHPLVGNAKPTNVQHQVVKRHQMQHLLDV